MTNFLRRYEPTCREIQCGIETQIKLLMSPDPDGAYINRHDLVDELNLLLDKACDPAETDTLNAIIRLVKTRPV